MVPTILNLSRHTGLHLYTRNQARAAASMSMTWHIGIISCLVFVTFAGALTNRSPQNSTSRYRGLLTFCRGQLLSPAIGHTIYSQLNCVICALPGCSLSFTNTLKCFRLQKTTAAIAFLLSSANFCEYS